MKKIQVFNYIDMNKEVRELMWFFEATNDTYHRWYPKDVKDSEEVGQFCKFKNKKEQNKFKILNKWLIKNGMEIDDKNDYFHILIHMSW